MKLLEINWNPTDRQLRQFGLIALIALPTIGWIWGASGQWLTTLAVIGGVIAAASFAFPKLIQPLFIGLMVVATPIGLVIGEIAMLLIFFGMFLPLGLCFRLMRRDALALKLDRDADTYWSPKQQPAARPAITDNRKREAFLKVRTVTSEDNTETANQPTEFEQAGQEDELSLMQEFVLFIRENKKWWMIPIVLAIGAMGLLVALSTTGAAPFIYTLF